MLVLHLSDLHLTRYGESGLWTHRDNAGGTWEILHTWQRWQVEGERDKKGRPDNLRLVDPEGVIHWQRSWPKRKDEKMIGSMLSRAMERHLRSAEHLVRERPNADDLTALVKVDSSNTNLRFLHLLDQISTLNPDIIVITGDVTDNGFGYELVTHYLKDWIDKDRLLVIPGNHDTYDMFPRRGRSKRIAVKEARYREFAKAVGVEPNPTGAFVRRIDDVAFIGLSSCKPPRTPLSASGEVSKEQLIWLKELGKDPGFRDSRLRIGLLHHHILRMPFEMGKRSPIEVGLRLRNAEAVMEACTEAKVDILMHGHRHHGYMVKLPGHPMVISSPSSTMGCKYTDKRYVWSVELASKHPFPIMHPLLD
jgi:3',5'-cyclic-AMP phosphodiesterase